MAQAIGNPEEIIRFANELQRYEQTLQEETSRLNSAFARLGESWKDAKRAEFEENLRTLTSAMGKFRNNVNEQVPHLRALANKLQEYLSH